MQVERLNERQKRKEGKKDQTKGPSGYVRSAHPPKSLSRPSQSRHPTARRTHDTTTRTTDLHLPHADVGGRALGHEALPALALLLLLRLGGSGGAPPAAAAEQEARRLGLGLLAVAGAPALLLLVVLVDLERGLPDALAQLLVVLLTGVALRLELEDILYDVRLLALLDLPGMSCEGRGGRQCSQQANQINPTRMKLISFFIKIKRRTGRRCAPGRRPPRRCSARFGYACACPSAAGPG